MNTVKVNVSELSGAALDWCVAKCEALPVARHNTGTIYLIDTPWADKSRIKWLAEYSPSKHWAQGGPIIDREHICLRPTFTEGGYRTDKSMDAVNAKIDLPNGSTVFDPVKVVQEYGPTPLIAAMRCYVASKLGEVVEVPAELMG